MNLAAAITSDLRSRASFLPYCPLCSLQVGLPEQILSGPSLRVATLKGADVVKLVGCCRFSTPPDEDNLFESEAAAAAWWRAKRQEPVYDIATDERRKRTLARLTAANLEPIE